MKRSCFLMEGLYQTHIQTLSVRPSVRPSVSALHHATPHTTNITMMSEERPIQAPLAKQNGPSPQHRKRARGGGPNNWESRRGRPRRNRHSHIQFGSIQERSQLVRNVKRKNQSTSAQSVELRIAVSFAVGLTRKRAAKN